jgi:hypothetical protein
VLLLARFALLLVDCFGMIYPVARGVARVGGDVMDWKSPFLAGLGSAFKPLLGPNPPGHLRTNCFQAQRSHPEGYQAALKFQS